jgi:phage FluMu protein Com
VKIASPILLTILIIVLNIINYFNMSDPLPETIGVASETRCECGQLIAKIRGQRLELKCKRCKRIVVIPFSSIEGWSTVQSPVHS